MEAMREADFENVEVVGFGETGPTFDVGSRHEFLIAWTRKLDSGQCAQLRALLAALPSAESARCHMPPFGLRFGAGQKEVRASLCFQCDNAYVGGELAAFAASSGPAQLLLAFLRAQAPSDWQSTE